MRTMQTVTLLFGMTTFLNLAGCDISQSGNGQGVAGQGGAGQGESGQGGGPVPIAGAGGGNVDTTGRFFNPPPPPPMPTVAYWDDGLADGAHVHGDFTTTVTAFAQGQTPVMTLIWGENGKYGTSTNLGRTSLQDSAHAVPDGPLWMRGEARDASGALLATVERTLTVDNASYVMPVNQPPTVRFTAPTEGSMVSGVFTVTVEAADDTAVTRTLLYRLESNVPIATGTTSVIATVDSRAYGQGQAINLYARTEDAAGAYGLAYLTLFASNPPNVGGMGGGGAGGVGGSGGTGGDGAVNNTVVHFTDLLQTGDTVAGMIIIKVDAVGSYPIDHLWLQVVHADGQTTSYADIPGSTGMYALNTAEYVDGPIQVTAYAFVNRPGFGGVGSTRTFIVANHQTGVPCNERIAPVIGTGTFAVVNVPLVDEQHALYANVLADCSQRWWMSAYGSVLSYYGLAHNACVQQALADVSSTPTGAACYPDICYTPVGPFPAHAADLPAGIHGMTVKGQISESQFMTEIANGRPVVIGDESRFETFVVYGYSNTADGVTFKVMGVGTGLYGTGVNGTVPELSWSQISYDLGRWFQVQGWSGFRWNYSIIHLADNPMGCNEDFDPACPVKCQ
ncbi:MAG: hypothetical protein RLZZ324_734 [Candidatus Parcubacteria bacterium]|jgi:hypothetical protein